jgi:predicted ATPase with chaperone activity
VQAARERQLSRCTDTNLTCNAEMGANEVHDCCKTDEAGEKLLKAAM